MKYSLMRFGGSIWPRRGRIPVYVLPVCADPEEYSVLYPRHLEKGRFRDIVGRVISIKQFQGCTDRAELAVKEKIKSLLIRRLEKYTSKLTALIFGGIAMVILGVANFAFPDPIILADEILLIVGGTIITVLSCWARRDALPSYRDRVEAQLRAMSRVVPEPGPFLTRIFRTLCEKAEPSDEGAEDRIEAESRWLYEYVDIGEMIDKGECSPGEIMTFLKHLQDVLPLKRLAKMGSVGISPKTARRFREKISRKTGFSDDALVVYGEFYKSLKAYLDGRGERI